MREGEGGNETDGMRMGWVKHTCIHTYIDGWVDVRPFTEIKLP